MNKAIFLQEEKVVLAASHDNAVRVYGIDKAGEPRSTFSHHPGCVRDVVQLECDLVASLGDDNRLLSWRPLSTEPVGQWENDCDLYSVTKLDLSRVIVGDWKGEVIVSTHN